MILPEAPTGEAALRLRAGRSLCFSPTWKDEGCSVVFDRNSGDFWVVTDRTRALLEALASPETPFQWGEPGDQAEALVSELVAATLIEPAAHVPAPQTRLTAA